MEFDTNSESKTLSNLSSRLVEKETRQAQGNEVQRDIAGSSAFSAKKSFGAYKQKHTKTDYSEINVPPNY